jgi:hypothetical protein
MIVRPLRRRRDEIVAWWLIASLVITASLALHPAPAHARYGASLRSKILSVDGVWVQEATKRVHPGRHIGFEIKGVGSANPSTPPDPVVEGCDGAGGFDVRYRLVEVRQERNITKAVIGHGWTQPRGKNWKVFVRLGVFVGPHVAHGATFACRVSVNDRTVQANVRVR